MPWQQPGPVRRLLGYVAQEVAIDKILTGRELLALQADLYHLSAPNRDDRITELIESLDMGDWIDRRCGSYSGGMRRRLDLAAGLLHQPAVLVLDEPTVGLDIESRTAIWQALRQLRDQGTTVLLSSHYLEEVDVLADRLAIVESGRVIAEGTPTELKQALGGDRVTLRVREFSDQTGGDQGGRNSSRVVRGEPGGGQSCPGLFPQPRGGGLRCDRADSDASWPKPNCRCSPSPRADPVWMMCTCRPPAAR